MKSNKDYDRNDEEFEDEFFDDDNKNLKLKVLILFGVLFLVVLVLIIVLLFMNKSDDESDLQNNIVEYSQQEIATAEPIPTPEIIEEPTATPEEKVIDREEEETPEPEITPALTPVASPTPNAPFMEVNSKEAKKIKKTSYDIKRNLSELEGYFDANNLEAMNDLAHLDRYVAMSLNLDYGSCEYAYYGDTNAEGKPHGKGIAVYADNQYYSGQWVNGKREGAGVWVHYHIHFEKNYQDPVIFHEFIGNFKNDLPDGHGQDHYEYDTIRMQPGKSYFSNVIGDYSKGYVNGEMYVTTQNKENNWMEFTGTAKAGSFESLGANSDPKAQIPVLMDTHNPDNYYWLYGYENKNIGVDSYISTNKK